MNSVGELEKVLGPLQANVLRAVLAEGRPVTVRDVLDRLNRKRRGRPLAYTTVMTVMSRLTEKGVLARTLRGRRYVYEPAAHDAAEIAVRHVLREFGAAAMAHFVEEARADPRILRRLERLLGEEG